MIHTDMMCQAEEAVLEYEKSSEQQRWRRLVRSGIRMSSSCPKGNLRAQYHVEVCCLRALRITRLEIRGIGNESTTLLRSEQHSTLFQRLERYAIKIVYTLGLDHGLVILDAAKDGTFTMVSVHPAPWRDHTDRFITYLEAMKRVEKEIDFLKQSSQDPILGMDPEFVLVKMPDKKVIPASLYLSKTGIAGFDTVNLADGQSCCIAELRPKPSSEPRQLIVHLLHALQIAASSITDSSVIWQSGAMPQRGLPLGGHVHFSRVVLTGKLLRALDNYLALPLSLLEDPRGIGRRPIYGVLGDFRHQSHGGFEYRTLPSFLISPMVSKGVVALAALIANNYDLLERCPLQHHEVHAAFYANNRQVLQAFIPDLIQDLISVPSFSKYDRYVTPLIHTIEEGRTWDQTQDIRHRWNITTNR